jgi:two-component system, chemotaxis family, chemotaxis protein CheY
MVLVIEDCKFSRSIIVESVSSAGFHIGGHAVTGKEGIELAIELEPDLITLDNMLPDMTGVEVIKSLHRKNVFPKIIMISAIDNPSVIDECKKLGVDVYLTKPINTTELKNRIKSIYSLHA